MTRLEWPAMAIAALCAGPILFIGGFRDLRVRRLVQNTPTSRIRSMAMGLVEICGTVLQRNRLSAPFSGRPCAYWEVDIAVQGPKRQGWSVVHRRSSGHPFYVRDDTGVALVYPQGATCRTPETAAEICAGFSLPSMYNDYMREQGLWMRHFWRLSTLRFRERALEEGQHAYVLGTAEPRARALDVSQPDELQATGTDGPPAARPRPLHEQVVAVVRRGAYAPAFVISSESELALTTRLALSTAGKLLGGPVLTLFGLFYWLVALSPR